MIKRSELKQIREQFESDPSRIGKDDKFAQLFYIARMVEDIDISINALSAIVNDPDCLQNLRNAWSKFLEKEKLP